LQDAGIIVSKKGPHRMAWVPCYFCGLRFIGPATTAYHRWTAGEIQVGYRQKACPSCAKVAWESLLPCCIPTQGDGAEWPETCKACGGSLSRDFQPSYHTFFLKKQRTDLVAALCDACSMKMRPGLMVGEDCLPDRQADSPVIDGGAVVDGDSLLRALGREP
jgi:hypothetical protein